MAGRPKERRLKAKLAEIAKREIGPHATSIDWVVQRVADGVTVGKIAEYLAQEMNESVSRSFFSWHINNATPDAKARIRAARKDATHVWAEQTLDIAARPVSTTAEVQQARLQIETRRWLTAVFNREEFSEKQQHEVTLDLGQLHLAALRTYNAKQVARTEPLAVEIISEDATPALLSAGEPLDE
jgi:hypothetical protein